MFDWCTMSYLGSHICEKVGESTQTDWKIGACPYDGEIALSLLFATFSRYQLVSVMIIERNATLCGSRVIFGLLKCLLQNWLYLINFSLACGYLPDTNVPLCNLWNGVLMVTFQTNILFLVYSLTECAPPSAINKFTLASLLSCSFVILNIFCKLSGICIASHCDTSRSSRQ